MHTFSKFPGIGDVNHIVASTSRDGRMRSFKSVVPQRNEVVIGGFTTVKNLDQSTRNDQIVIAKKPDILSARLLKTLQEVRVRSDVLLVPDVPNAQSAGNEFLYNCWCLVRGSIVRDD